jgi:hypothetical protein
MRKAAPVFMRAHLSSFRSRKPHISIQIDFKDFSIKAQATFSLMVLTENLKFVMIMLRQASNDEDFPVK